MSKINMKEMKAKARIEVAIAESKREFKGKMLQISAVLATIMLVAYVSTPEFLESLFLFVITCAVGLYYGIALFIQNYVRSPVSNLVAKIGLRQDYLDKVDKDLLIEWNSKGCSQRQFNKEIRKVLYQDYK